MNIDLHCHSFYSDGKHSPDYLVQQARELQLSHLAITDHDHITELDATVDTTGVTLIPGVEISTAWDNQEIHIVGLGIDTQNKNMQQLLVDQQNRRRDRLAAIADKLSKLGNTGLKSYMESLPCVSYTRSHVADYLVNSGLSKNRQKAFKNYLGKRGRIYEPANWCTLKNAIEAINGASGIAVLAHPGRYPLGKRKLEKLVEDFAAAGGEAMEVSYSNIDPIEKNRLSELSKSKSLYASVGSDFHDAAAHWTRLGKYPSLDASTNENAIWNHSRWHF